MLKDGFRRQRQTGSPGHERNVDNDCFRAALLPSSLTRNYHGSPLFDSRIRGAVGVRRAHFAAAHPGAPASAGASSMPFDDMTMWPRSKASDKLVLQMTDVQAWSSAVRNAGRSVVVSDDSVTGKSDCIDVTLYEDAGAYLHRFGTWRVCGSAAQRSPDD
jgi:hypothetical protein